MICLHTSWLVAHDSQSEACADCGMVVMFPEGTPQFIDDESDRRATPERVGDVWPMTDEYRVVGYGRAKAR